MTKITRESSFGTMVKLAKQDGAGKRKKFLKSQRKTVKEKLNKQFIKYSNRKEELA